MPDYVPISELVNAPAENVILRLTTEGASIAGHVYLKSTGESVADAMVVAEPPQSRLKYSPLSPRSSRTDHLGAFLIQRLPAGFFHLNAQKENLVLFPGKNPKANEIILAAKEKKSGIELYLYEGHTIKGSVKDADTALPIEGVKISLKQEKGEDQYTALTNAEGQYVLDGVNQPIVRLVAEKKGYIPLFQYNFEPYFELRLSPELLIVTKDIRMRKEVVISGKVLTEDNRPVAGAEVYLCIIQKEDMPRIFTPVDGSGAFSLPCPPYVYARILARAAGYAKAYSNPVQVGKSPVENVNVILRKGASVSGSVVDPEDRPVPNALVRAANIYHLGMLELWDNVQECFTDDKGNFQLQDLPGERASLLAEKEGFVCSKWAEVPLSPGDEKTGVKLVLIEATFLAGKVSNMEDKPVEGVRVYVYGEGGYEMSRGMDMTDFQGHYRVENIARALHSVNLSHPDYAGELYPGVEAGRDDADFVIGKNQGITMIGKVVDWKTNKPIRDFQVSSNSSSPIDIDPDTPGVFRARNLFPEASYMFHIEAPGYQDYDSEPILIPKFEEQFQRTFPMGPGGTIKGRVVKSQGKEALAGVEVYLKGTGSQWQVTERVPRMSYTTAEDGRFRFENVYQGRNTVLFFPPSPYVEQTRQVDVDHEKTADLGDVEIGSGGTIRGRVVQLPDDIPLPSVTVQLLKNFTMEVLSEKKTDANGMFEFGELNTDEFRVMVPDYKVSQDIRIVENEVQECILRVGLCVLKGTVLKRGEPMLVHITLLQTNLDNRKHTQTDKNGCFEIRDLPPGLWNVLIRALDTLDVLMSESVDIPPLPVFEKVFEFPCGRITGRVVDQGDKPISGAKISVRRTRPLNEEDRINPRIWGAMSGQDGSFAVGDLPGDSYMVSGTKEDLGVAVLENVLVPRNADSEPVLLRLGSTEGGTLVSVALNLSSGKPVPEAWCRLTNEAGVGFDHGQKRDEQGVMRIPNISPGKYHVEVSAFTFSVHEHMVEIKTGETVEIEDVLYEAGALRFTLLDKSGSPLAQIPCRIEPLDPKSMENPREGKTDASGLWIVRGLFPGEYKVTATLSNGRQVSERVLIKVRELTQKEVIVAD